MAHTADGAAHFYPRPPRGGRLSWITRRAGAVHHFYPRPPRGGRQNRRSWQSSLWNFYPRPPRGGRLRTQVQACRAVQISIHALREEGDSLENPVEIKNVVFLSTPSARRATRVFHVRMGVLRNFYPRPPRGGRPRYCTRIARFLAHFYPRPPRGGRRRTFAPRFAAFLISIHALREEGDFSSATA